MKVDRSKYIFHKRFIYIFE